MEKFGRPLSPSEQRAEAEFAMELNDFKDTPELYDLLRRLPGALRSQHIQRIADLSDEQASGYLYALHEKREKAMRESAVSDESLAQLFAQNGEQIWTALETNVFTDAENHVGAGTTARIKKFDLSTMGDPEAPEVAVKYLVSPTTKTLSVSGEHDLIVELEQIKKIEAAEFKAFGTDSRVRVPHPYFYYRKGATQCYAMELIDGVNLEQGVTGSKGTEVMSDIKEALKDLDEDALMQELDLFFTTMHGVCLHGDVKPRNLMVSRTGQFYVIDFGQSVLATSVTEKANEAFEQLKDDEKKNAKEIVRRFLNSLQTNSEQSNH